MIFLRQLNIGVQDGAGNSNDEKMTLKEHVVIKSKDTSINCGRWQQVCCCGVGVVVEVRHTPD